ncbi:MAG: SMP-30/gluconolactonase/LRE family protein [Verrucomicrobiota bacterium]
MNRLILLGCFWVLAHLPIAAEEFYPVHPDMKAQDRVPSGVIRREIFDRSVIYPGTTREYAVYVPAQYDEKEPAALMVFQDGLSYLKVVPTAFDNLIHSGDMPVTVGLFVNPGVVPPMSETDQPRYNRSFEYDAVSDLYAQFLLEELMPVALEGLRISNDPNLRATCGSSSGGIAAFTLAWERPDQFRRVFTTVGTYVGLRGGNEYPVLVRKTMPKPLRVFLQDGRNDNDIYCGSWWIANQDMLSSLQWAGYEVNHEWGEGGHNRKHGYAIFPDVMRWLWSGWKDGKPVETHPGRSNSIALNLTAPGSEWEVVSEGHLFTEGPAIRSNGDLFFTDLDGSKIWKLTKEGEETLFQENTGGTNGLAFGPDGQKLYGCQREPGRLVSWDVDTGQLEVHATGVRPNDLAIAHDGAIYFSEPRKKAIWVILPGEEPKIAADSFSGVNGVILSPDQQWVYAADYGGRYVWSGRRNQDGTLSAVQPFVHLHLPPASVDTRSLADGMAVTEEGWLFVATAMGLQVCDPPGRVNAILPTPPGIRHPSNVIFDGRVLYATCGDKVLRREMQVEGVQGYEPPIQMSKPKL